MPGPIGNQHRKENLVKIILQVFVPVAPGSADHKPIMPTPIEFNSTEMHSMSLAINAWVAQNPGLPNAKNAAFKIDAVRGACNRWVRENS